MHAVFLVVCVTYLNFGEVDQLIPRQVCAVYFRVVIHLWKLSRVSIQLP